MRVIEIEGGIRLEEADHFDAKHIFECGQCFRWKRESDDSYTGVAFGRVLNVKSDYEARKVTLKNTNPKDFENIWFNYFDLGRDYEAIHQKLGQDPVMKLAIQHGAGIRILNQDPWELLISFIISSNSNIPRIMKSINILSQMYGDMLMYRGDSFFAFPAANAIAAAAYEDILLCRAGYRTRYIHETSRMIASGAIDLKQVINNETDEARKQLMKLPGVGPKVADCILLFSMQRHEVYPIDVWVKRVTEHYYLNKDTSPQEIRQFAKKHFGKLAGFAQQYLFYFAREQKLK